MNRQWHLGYKSALVTDAKSESPLDYFWIGLSMSHRPSHSPNKDKQSLNVYVGGKTQVQALSNMRNSFRKPGVDHCNEDN